MADSCGGADGCGPGACGHDAGGHGVDGLGDCGNDNTANDLAADLQGLMDAQVDMMSSLSDVMNAMHQSAIDAIQNIR